MIDLENYWNPQKLLPYQRHFIFVNSIRGCGKSYTLQWFLLKKAIREKKQFMFLVRTQDEIKSSAFQSSFEKVCAVEYPEYDFVWNKDQLNLQEDDKIQRPLGFCRPLSAAVKVKKQSFPNVYYAMMDEYMLEPKDQDKYVKGWHEPDAVLSIYDTIDRDEDRLYMFLLGNNTCFYNPYHMHPAFRIPETKEGDLWMSDNVLFQFYRPSEFLANKKKNSKFRKMVENTEYGKYANQGIYVGDNNDFIKEKTKNASYVMKIIANGVDYGVWSEGKTLIISNRFINSYGLNIALTKDDMKEGVNYAKSDYLIKWMTTKLRKGLVYYESQEIKVRVKPVLEKWL